LLGVSNSVPVNKYKLIAFTRGVKGENVTIVEINKLRGPYFTFVVQMDAH